MFNDTRQAFLLSFFPEHSGYAEKEINGFWLKKYQDGATKKWLVAIYTKEAFEKSKAYLAGDPVNERMQSQSRLQYLIDKE
jgi:hypothetical protein